MIAVDHLRNYEFGIFYEIKWCEIWRIFPYRKLEEEDAVRAAGGDIFVTCSSRQKCAKCAKQSIRAQPRFPVSRREIPRSNVFESI